MKKISTIQSTALPLRTENIDTDQIIPAQFLKLTDRSGFGEKMFYRWRYNDDGTKKESIFWDPKYKEAKILIAGNNFGCGSSREHAPWALLGYGYEAIISSSFGDIFYGNCLKNGLLPVTVSHEALDHLVELVELEPKTEIVIDLETQTVIVPAAKISYDFPIDQFRKACLLNGVDELGYILNQVKTIEEFEKGHRVYVGR